MASPSARTAWLTSEIARALVLRGSRDFVSPDEYLAFVRELVARKRNTGIEEKLAVERTHLKPLPHKPIPSYTAYTVTVRRWSTISVGGRIYSVPSRLRDHAVRVRWVSERCSLTTRGRSEVDRETGGGEVLR